MIKDAKDHGVSNPCVPSAAEEERLDDFPCYDELVSGRERLAALYSDRAQWEALPCWKAKHKERRGIDRRYDGPKRLRTRDYDSDGWSRSMH